MRLRQNQETPTLPQNYTKVVYNLSDRQLSKVAEQVLSKGIENAISILELNTAETVRQEVCTVLRNIRPSKKNLSTEKLKVLIELKRDEKIVILPADKGNATMVLTTRDYKDKMQKLLDDPTYNSITTDPTTYLEKTTRTKINNASLSKETKKSIIPREKSSKCPKI
ncbi:hypothetical protein Trydic_g20561 [Trypoxylus dichotomus]